MPNFLFFSYKRNSNSSPLNENHTISLATSLASWRFGWRKNALNAETKIVDAITANRTSNKADKKIKNIKILVLSEDDQKAEVDERQKVAFGEVVAKVTNDSLSPEEFEKARDDIAQALVDSNDALRRAQEDAQKGDLNAINDYIENAKETVKEAKKALVKIMTFVDNYDGSESYSEVRDFAIDSLNQTIFNFYHTEQKLPQAEQVLQEKENTLHRKTIEESQGVIEKASKAVIDIYREQIQGRSYKQIKENLALMEINSPNSPLKDCIDHIIFSLPSDPSDTTVIPSDDEIAKIVKQYIKEPSIKNLNLTVSSILDETNTSIQENDVVVYKPERGLYVVPDSELKNQFKQSLRQGVEQLATAIGQEHGRFLEQEFRNLFLPKGKPRIPLTIQEARGFFKSTLMIGKNAIVLSNAEDVQLKFNELNKEPSPQKAEIYIAAETYSPSEMGIGCFESTGGPAEPINDIVLSSATYRRLNQEECTTLKEGCVSLMEQVNQELEESILPSEETINQQAPLKEAIKNQIGQHISNQEEVANKVTRMLKISKIKAKIDALSRNDDWGRFKIQINGVDITLYDTKSRRLNIDAFKLKIEELTKKEPSDMQIVEMLILMSNDGRTSGFPSGGDINTGFTLAGVEKAQGLPEIVNITYDATEGKIGYNYTSTEGVLKAVVLPHEEGGQIIKKIIDFDRDFNGVNLGEKDELKRLQVKTTYTYLCKPPGDDNSYDPGSFSERFEVQNSDQLIHVQ